MTDSSRPGDPFEALARLWAPLGAPPPGMTMPTFDPAEVAKRIADLRAVEGWLQMNLNMVKVAIGGLEAQKAVLEGLREPGATADPAPDAGAAATHMAMAWPWSLLAQAMSSAAAPTPSQDGEAASPRKPQGD